MLALGGRDCWKRKKKKRLERSGRREKEKAAAAEKRKERKKGASQRGLWGGHPGDCRGEKQDKNLGRQEECEQRHVGDNGER